MIDDQFYMLLQMPALTMQALELVKPFLYFSPMSGVLALK